MNTLFNQLKEQITALEMDEVSKYNLGITLAVLEDASAENNTISPIESSQFISMLNALLSENKVPLIQQVELYKIVSQMFHLNFGKISDVCIEVKYKKEINKKIIDKVRKCVNEKCNTLQVGYPIYIPFESKLLLMWYVNPEINILNKSMLKQYEELRFQLADLVLQSFEGIPEGVYTIPVISLHSLWNPLQLQEFVKQAKLNTLQTFH